MGCHIEMLIKPQEGDANIGRLLKNIEPRLLLWKKDPQFKNNALSGAQKNEKVAEFLSVRLVCIPTLRFLFHEIETRGSQITDSYYQNENSK